VTKKLLDLTIYKEKVQREADAWIEKLAELHNRSTEEEYIDSGEALDVLGGLQAFLCEVVNEGMSSA
jgi:hypothetical protein